MKKSLPLTVLLAALALIGCGKTSEASMASADASFVEGTKTSAKPIGDTETTSEAASAKESVAPVVHTVDLKAFLAGLGSHSLTLESDSGTFELYNDNAIQGSSTDDSGEESTIGLVHVQGKGTFLFDVDGNTLELGRIYSLGGTIDDITGFFTALDLLAGSADLWEPNAKVANKYTTSDTNLIAALMSLDGYSEDDAANFPTKFIMNLREDGTATFSAAASKLGKVISIGFSAIGTTRSAAVDAFLANPVVVTPTDFSADTKAGFAAVLGDTFTVPYCDKFTYAWDNQTARDGSYFSYYDFGCGNVLADYKTTLEAGGWAFDEDQSNMTALNSDGYYMGYFSKELTPETDTAGSVDAVLLAGYYPRESINDAVNYPNGVFILQATTVQNGLKITELDAINARLTSVLKADQTPALVALDFGTATPTNVTLVDNTADVAAQGVQAYFTLTAETASDEESVTALTAYANALVGNGLETKHDDDIAKLATNKSLSLSLTDTAFSVLFNVSMAIDDGGFSITVIAM